MFDKTKTKADKKITESDLVAMIDNQLSTSNTYTTKINNERAQSLKYYNSQPYGNEKKGRSSYVSSEVLETITWALPQILKVFETNDDIVKFDPISPESIEQANLATLYCEYVFRKQNNGFIILHTLFHDALLQKNGIVKVYFDTSKEYTREVYEGLSDEEVVQLLNQDGVEAIDRETTEKEIQVPGVNPMTGQPELQTQTQRTHTITVKKLKNAGKGRTRIENVPPEEIIVSRQAKSLNLDESPFVAHKVKKTISWLRSQGYDVEDDISDTEIQNTDYSPEKIVRDSLDGSVYRPNEENIKDPSQRLVHICEAYMRVDYDGDGIAEWRKITKVGQKVLDNVECYSQPFVSTTPLPNPHKFYGMSLADLLQDIQYLKSLLMRAMLDSFAFNINPAKAINTNMIVDMNDLLDTTPGKWIQLRGDANNAITSLPSNGIGTEGLNLLTYIDDISEKRSGVSPHTQGIDSNAFNKTASGTSAIMNASQEKIMLITRIFAETGLAEIYKKILQVAQNYITTEQLIKTGNQFITVNPREWTDLETLSVNVGTGSVDKQQDSAQAQTILGLQTQLLQSGRPDLMSMVDAEKIFNAGSTILKSMGKKNVSDYFNDPRSQAYQNNLQMAQQQAQQPPPPDPMIESAKIQAQALAQKNQQDMMLKAAQFEHDSKMSDADREIKKYDLTMKYQLELAKQNHKQESEELQMLREDLEKLVSLDINTIPPQPDLNAIHQTGFGNQ